MIASAAIELKGLTSRTGRVVLRRREAAPADIRWQFAIKLKNDMTRTAAWTQRRAQSAFSRYGRIVPSGASFTVFPAAAAA
jgi:hypothetical protein